MNDILQTLSEYIRAGDAASVQRELEQRAADYAAAPHLSGQLPFDEALRCESEEICLLLMRHGLTRSAVKFPPLHRAVFSANLVRELLNAGEDPRRECPVTGAGPVYKCAAAGSLESLELLVAVGADVNTRNSRHNVATPLEAAAIRIHPEMVEALLRFGADPRVPYNGITALHLVAGATAAQKHDPDQFARVVRLLINAGMPINGADRANGNTPLHHAAIAGWVPAVQILLDHGAVPCPRHADGRTPADLAKQLRKLDTFALLQAYDARKAMLSAVSAPHPG